METKFRDTVKKCLHTKFEYWPPHFSCKALQIWQTSFSKQLSWTQGNLRGMYRQKTRLFFDTSRNLHSIYIIRRKVKTRKEIHKKKYLQSEFFFKTWYRLYTLKSGRFFYAKRRHLEIDVIKLYLDSGEIVKALAWNCKTYWSSDGHLAPLVSIWVVCSSNQSYWC